MILVKELQNKRVDLLLKASGNRGDTVDFAGINLIGQ